MAIGPIGKLLVARTMRWLRFAVLAVGALVALGAFAFAGSPDEIGSWALGDEAECFAAASVMAWPFRLLFLSIHCFSWMTSSG